MPAGVTWGQYVRFCIAATATMLAGSQVVHQHYKPLRDINVHINRELSNLPEHVQATIRNELKEEGVLD